MRRHRISSLLVVAGCSALLACSGETEPADPGGMGAGRPAAPGAGEEPALPIVENANPGAMRDTAGADAPGTTGTLRDSMNTGG